MEPKSILQNRFVQIILAIGISIIAFIMIDYLWLVLLKISLVQAHQEYSGKKILRIVFSFFALLAGWLLFRKKVI